MADYAYTPSIRHTTLHTCYYWIYFIIWYYTYYKNSSSLWSLQLLQVENFWGSLVSQLGGTKVQVSSIVSDPNADPHEYESNTQLMLGTLLTLTTLF